MKRLLVAVVLCCPPRGGYCAAAEKVSAATRTLNELTALVMEKGEDDTLGENVAESLGFGKKPLPVKELYYYQEITPDGREHVYHVTFDGAKPKEIIWSSGKITVNDQKRTVDGYMFLLTLDGKLEKAVRPHGVIGEVVHDHVPLNVRTKALFQRELAFWTKHSIGLVWSK